MWPSLTWRDFTSRRYHSPSPHRRQESSEALSLSLVEVRSPRSRLKSTTDSRKSRGYGGKERMERAGAASLRRSRHDQQDDFSSRSTVGFSSPSNKPAEETHYWDGMLALILWCGFSVRPISAAASGGASRGPGPRSSRPTGRRSRTAKCPPGLCHPSV